MISRVTKRTQSPLRVASAKKLLCVRAGAPSIDACGRSKTATWRRWRLNGCSRFARMTSLDEEYGQAKPSVYDLCAVVCAMQTLMGPLTRVAMDTTVSGHAYLG
jgi:hypothetical protein